MSCVRKVVWQNYHLEKALKHVSKMSSVSQQGGKQLDLGKLYDEHHSGNEQPVVGVVESQRGKRSWCGQRGTALCTGWNPDQDCTDLREYNEVLYQIAVREGCAA